MGAAPSMSHLSKVIYSAVTGLTDGVRANLDSTSLRGQHQLISAHGNRGRRGRDLSRVRRGNRRGLGNVVSTPSDTELDFILPMAMGGALTDIGNTLPKFFVGVDKVADMFKYTGVVVSRLNLSAQIGQPVVMTIDLEATDEEDLATWPETDPGLDVSGEGFFILSDLVLTIGGTAREVPGFSLTIDNMLDTERFMNAKTREHIPSQDCMITLEIQVPYNSDNTDLYTIADAGVAGSLVLNNTVDIYTMTFGRLVAEQEGPSVETRQELQLPLTLEALRSNLPTAVPQLAIVKSAP